MQQNTAQNTPGLELKSELARLCLPAANRDTTRKLAWVNSICILFLLVGVTGARRAFISIHPPPPMEQVIPAVIEPLPPPPPTQLEPQKEDASVEPKAEAPQVVVVVPDSPAVSFSIPTIGNVVAPASMAQAPANIELKAEPTARIQMAPTTIASSGAGGERPQPPYPQIAQDLAQEGTVLLSITADQSGAITNIVVKQSSGFAILDRSTLDFVRRHWMLPAGEPGRVYEAPIRYLLAH